MAAACGLDRLVGDPPAWPHPVRLMGAAITLLRRAAERWAGDSPRRLRLAGGAITLILVGGSGAAGWSLERLAVAWWQPHRIGLLLLLIALASALAGRSLELAVRAVLEALPDLSRARERLAWIVGRDVDDLDEQQIVRAAAETAAENAVDGLFAPLFWMLLGAGLASRWPGSPGPLCLAWAFKAASTLDSMLGYRRGRLRWLGTAGARLDDLLTWLPCRLVALTLPLAAGRPLAQPRLFRSALRDGHPDPSPNAGVSQAAYAHAVGITLGGVNRYGGELRPKPLLAVGCPAADRHGVERILNLTGRLELIWLAAGMAVIRLLTG